MQRSASYDVGEARRLCGNKACAQAQLATEVDGGRLLRKQRVRPGVDHEAVDPLGQDHAACARGAFEQQESNPALLQLERGGQSRDASADYDDVDDGRSCRLRTRSARVSMNNRDVFSDWVRLSDTPQAFAIPAACTSMSNRISV